MNICTQCHTVNEGVKKTPGSFALELLIWGAGIIGGLIAAPLFFLVIVGLCYTMWRITNPYRVCSSCGHTGLVGLNSPAGQKLQGQNADKAKPHAVVDLTAGESVQEQNADKQGGEKN